MKWTKASERMPENGTIVFVKAVRDKPYNDIFKAAMLSDDDGFTTEYSDFFHKSKCEWLDETESPSDSEAVENILESLQSQVNFKYETGGHNEITISIQDAEGIIKILKSCTTNKHQ